MCHCEVGRYSQISHKIKYFLQQQNISHFHSKKDITRQNLGSFFPFPLDAPTVQRERYEVISPWILKARTLGKAKLKQKKYEKRSTRN